jgi:aryl-alcohol dehydrogenase-like predicted oxidoreductase
MKKVQLGKSELFISPIAFGAWAIGGWMWGGTNVKNAVAAIQKGIELGITTIDTAPIYGFGVSEEIVAEAIEGRRSEVEILTKFGLRWDVEKGEFYFTSQDNSGLEKKIYKYAGKESVIYECEQSLKRLKTDYIDLYQIHWADSTTPIEETMEAAATLLKSGKVRAIGVCNYSAEQVATAQKIVPIASNQVPYSMVERGIESKTIPYCVSEGIDILAYSPLQRGLLSGKIGMEHVFEAGDHRPFTKHFKAHNRKNILAFLAQIKPIADTHKATLSQLVLNWTLQQKGIACVLAGARNAHQIEENAGALAFELSANELTAINEALQKVVITD